MKKILLILFVAVGVVSCENFEIDHPDFKYTSGYFPYQFPVRTLVLGDYIYDNTNDNAHKFVVSVAMGGVYENAVDRKFAIEVDNNLCNNIRFSQDGDTIIALPSNYYTLSSNSEIVIPAGKLNGGIEVQLTDAFFADPKAIKNTYVVPIRLKSSTDVDTILAGSSLNANPDLRIVSEWINAPKNFTMFAVKYINEYHGNYFHYGSNKVKDDATGAEVETTTYSTPYVENNVVAKLTTTARKQVTLPTTFRSTKITGNYTLVLTFSGNNITVSAPAGSPYTISGTGVFVAKKYAWGNKSRDGIELTYKVTDATYTYEATEVLVARDRAVVMEVYDPVLF